MTSVLTPAASDSPAALREADAFGGTILTAASAPVIERANNDQEFSTQHNPLFQQPQSQDDKELMMAENENAPSAADRLQQNPHGFNDQAYDKGEGPEPGNLTETEANLLDSWGIEYDESKVDRNPRVGMPLEDSGSYVIEGDIDPSPAAQLRDANGIGVFHIKAVGEGADWKDFNADNNTQPTSDAFNEILKESAGNGAGSYTVGGGANAGGKLGVVDVGVDGSASWNNHPDADQAYEADAMAEYRYGSDMARGLDRVADAAYANTPVDEPTYFVVENAHLLTDQEIQAINTTLENAREDGADLRVIYTGPEGTAEQLENKGLDINPDNEGLPIAGPEHSTDNPPLDDDRDQDRDEDDRDQDRDEDDRDQDGRDQDDRGQDDPDQDRDADRPGQDDLDQDRDQDDRGVDRDQGDREQGDRDQGDRDGDRDQGDRGQDQTDGQPGQNVTIEVDNNTINYYDINVDQAEVTQNYSREAYVQQNNLVQQDTTLNVGGEVGVQEHLPQQEVPPQQMPQIPQDSRLGEMSEGVYRPDENPGQVSAEPYQGGASFQNAAAPAPQPGAPAPAGEMPNLNGFGFSTSTEYVDGTFTSQTAINTPLGGGQATGYIGPEGAGLDAHGIPAGQPIGGTMGAGPAQAADPAQPVEPGQPAEPVHPAAAPELQPVTTGADLGAELEAEVRVTYEETSYEQPQKELAPTVPDQSTPDQSAPGQTPDQQSTADQQGADQSDGGQGEATVDTQNQGQVGAADLAAEVDGETQAIENPAATQDQQIQQKTLSV